MVKVISQHLIDKYSYGVTNSYFRCVVPIQSKPIFVNLLQVTTYNLPITNYNCCCSAANSSRNVRSKAKLDGQGRARREAARRRKSEWKVNVAITNSSRSNGSWQVTLKTVSFSIVEPRGIWTCVSLQCTSTSGGSICAL